MCVVLVYLFWKIHNYFFALFIVMVAKVKRASETIGKLLMKLQDAEKMSRVSTHGSFEVRVKKSD